MIPEKKMASAVGAKTARACDICVRKRARFYCGPDDAFLCQACDDSVHSANPLARLHERVRLKTASSSSIKNAAFLPTWHRGPARKPRTPRHRKKSHDPNNNNHHLLVPELDTSTSMEDEQEEEEQLLYRVPVFEYDQYNSGAADLGSGISHGFLPPSDFDMAEFAADVEALLGKGLDVCGIQELGLLINDPHERDDSSAIKVEEEEEEMEALIREPFELSFDYDSPVDVKVVAEPVIYEEEEEEKKEWKKMLLRLDYDAISHSWGNQGSPWMNGKRPDLNPDDDFLPLSTTGDCGGEVQGNGEVGLMKGGQMGGDGGREARVSRYREKRRTRLFSKKIRYEVRKLNAEKRPRMKGRFVKRSSFPLLAK